ncbi:MAG: hypothetical protein ACYC3B_03625 [Sedimentisphaerales bacterium]
MTETKPCPLCKTVCPITGQISYNEIDGGGCRLNCPICGEYSITSRAEGFFEVRKENLHIISGVTRNFYEQYKKDFMIEKEMIRDDAKFEAEFVSKMPKSVLEKASLLLQYIAKKSKYPGDSVLIGLQDYPICFCKNVDELRFYINGLKENGDINVITMVREGCRLSLTTKGWQEIDSLNKPNLESKQAFVAMWFDSTMEEPFEKGILPLGDEKNENYTGFKMHRIDRKHFNDKICDHIIADIKQSRFMIADCTELRPAVFFEAGYAMGLGLPVIFTCKEGTDIKKCFDTDHYNHIVWKDAEDLKNKLRDRILATIGKAH